MDENLVNPPVEKDTSHLPVYFAKKNGSECVQVLEGKMQDWVNATSANAYLDKVRQCWEYYYGIFDRESFSEAHTIQSAGDQGELLRLNINQFRNIAQNMLVMTTSSRPKIETRAVNSDYKSMVQARLGSGLIDYYMREKDLETQLRLAAEYAIVLGSGYIKIDWDETAGKEIAYNEDTKTHIHDGDLNFSVLSPYDVVFDPSRETWNNDWLIVRTQKNRFDLAAKYPDMAEELLKVATVTDVMPSPFRNSYSENSDDVFVFEFIHKRTPAMPDGRYMIFCNDKTVMIDAAMPYRVMNVHRIVPNVIMGSPFGYSTMFDILPIQDAYNNLNSAAFTNLSAFGVQSIAVPNDANLSVSQFQGGMNFFKYDKDSGKPEGLNLTASAPELFNFLPQLEKVIETISGVNSVVRGNPEANLRSGSSLAVVQAQAVQFLSGLQQQYTKLVEDVSNGMLSILKDFAKTPRLAAIVGVSNKSKLVEFQGEDLESIDRVVCKISNPLQDTLAGRLALADGMMQYQLISHPKQYMQIIESGRLEDVMDDEVDIFELIKQENEMLLNGEKPVVIITDDHDVHILKHRAVLNNPKIRYEPEIVAATLAHIQEHIGMLKTVDPMILALLNQQSVAPAPSAQPVPGSTGDVAADPAAQGSGMEMNADAGQIEGGSLDNPVNLPSIPAV